MIEERQTKMILVLQYLVYFLFEHLFHDHLMRQLSLSLFEERETLIQKMYSYVLVFHKKNVFEFFFLTFCEFVLFAH